MWPALDSCVGLPAGVSRGPGPSIAFCRAGAQMLSWSHMRKQPNGTARQEDFGTIGEAGPQASTPTNGRRAAGTSGVV